MWREWCRRAHVPAQACWPERAKVAIPRAPERGEKLVAYVERMQQLAREQLNVDQARQALANIQRYSGVERASER